MVGLKIGYLENSIIEKSEWKEANRDNTLKDAGQYAIGKLLNTDKDKMAVIGKLWWKNHQAYVDIYYVKFYKVISEKLYNQLLS